MKGLLDYTALAFTSLSAEVSAVVADLRDEVRMEGLLRFCDVPMGDIERFEMVQVLREVAGLEEPVSHLWPSEVAVDAVVDWEWEQGRYFRRARSQLPFRLMGPGYMRIKALDPNG